jgi:hypothetical protein
MVGYGLVLLVHPIQLSTLNLVHDCDLKFELLSFIKSLVASLFCVEFFPFNWVTYFIGYGLRCHWIVLFSPIWKLCSLILE